MSSQPWSRNLEWKGRNLEAGFIKGYDMLPGFIKGCVCPMCMFFGNRRSVPGYVSIYYYTLLRTSFVHVPVLVPLGFIMVKGSRLTVDLQ